MKLHFEDNLPHQLAAIEAVCDLFRGQEVCRTEFTVTQRSVSPQMGLALEQGMEESALGIGNRGVGQYIAHDCGQVDGEGRAVAEHTAHTDVATHDLAEAAAQGQAEAGAAVAAGS